MRSEANYVGRAPVQKSQLQLTAFISFESKVFCSEKSFYLREAARVNLIS